MRLLNKNKITLWCAEQSDPTELMADGCYTGDISYTYSDLRQIKVNLTGKSGMVNNAIQGLEVSGNFVFTVTNEIITPKTVLYFNEPGSNLDDYDLFVTDITPSLNWRSVTVKRRMFNETN